MIMLHSAATWEPDLSSPAQVGQAEQNWPGIGATDAALAAWARLYGTAALDVVAAAADGAGDVDKAWQEGYDDSEKERQAAEKERDEAKAELATIEREWRGALDCINAMRWALEREAGPARLLGEDAVTVSLADLEVWIGRLRDVV
jgi:hypothetical protein